MMTELRTWLANFIAPPRKRSGTTGYAAASISRLTESLATETEFINKTLRYQLRILRARSRQATQNNPHGRRFRQMVVDNVCGPVPFRLQAKIKSKQGRMLYAANRDIERLWKGWGRKGQCEITGRFSRNALDRLIVGVLATDGEVLLRRFRGPQFGEYGYQYQLIDVDRLDERNNKRLSDGGAVHMGVEMDSVSRPVAYHLLKRKPSAWEYSYERDYEVVPASEILHIFIPEFAEQVRGVPWMYAALLNLVHLGAFEEAAVIAARVGASQMGFIVSPDGPPEFGEGEDPKGNPEIEAEPAAFPVLPRNYDVRSWNPKYPDGAYDPFTKACLRGVATGLCVANHNLTGDMGGVNYSSARIAELGEREMWKAVQEFIVEHYKDPEYESWLRMQILLGNLPFSSSERIDRYLSVRWQARRWAWVDPLKEVNAQIVAINNRLRSRTDAVSENGRDFEDVIDEIVAEEKLAEDKGVELSAPAAQTPAAQAPADSADTTDTTDATDGGVGAGTGGNDGE